MTEHPSYHITSQIGTCLLRQVAVASTAASVAESGGVAALSDAPDSRAFNHRAMEQQSFVCCTQLDNRGHS